MMGYTILREKSTKSSGEFYGTVSTPKRVQTTVI